MMSSRGVAAALVGELLRVHEHLDLGLEDLLVGRPGTRGPRSRSCGCSSRRSCGGPRCGTPMSSAMTSSGSSAATSTTKSHSPLASALSRMPFGELADVRLELADHAGREAAVDELAVAGVVGRVHHAASGSPPASSASVRDAARSSRPTTPPRACVGRERCRRRGCTWMTSACLVITQKPGPSGSGWWYTGVVRAQPGEPLVRDALREPVPVEQVDVGELHRAPPQRPWNCGVRFSMKASGPSLASSLMNTGMPISRVDAHGLATRAGTRWPAAPAARPAPRPARSPRPSSATSRARSSAVPSGTTSPMRPISLASGARQVAAGEQDVGGERVRDLPAQPHHRPAQRVEAPPHLGHAEPGALPGDADVGALQDLGAAGDGRALDRGDERLVEQEALEQRLDDAAWRCR